MQFTILLCFISTAHTSTRTPFPLSNPCCEANTVTSDTHTHTRTPYSSTASFQPTVSHSSFLLLPLLFSLEKARDTLRQHLNKAQTKCRELEQQHTAMREERDRMKRERDTMRQRLDEAPWSCSTHHDSLFALSRVPVSLFIPLPSSFLSMCLSMNTSSSHRSAALARCVFVCVFVCLCVCVCVSGVRVLSARGACTFEPRFIGPCGAGSTLNNQVLHKLAQPPLVLQTACP